MTNSETSLESINKTEKLPETQLESDQEFKEDSMKDYYQLKQNLLLGTLIITIVCFISVWAFYSLNVALNYLLGAIFGIVYLNILAREVEKIGTAKRRLSPTRLALFIGLMVIVFKLEQLQIVPIFLGFLTYKATVLFYILPSSLFKSVK